MLSLPTSWQWWLTLRPDPVSGQGERVLRAPSGALLTQALARSIEPRWRDSFDAQLVLAAQRPGPPGHTLECLKVSLGVGRGHLDALVERAVIAMERALAMAEDPELTGGEHTWLFEHAYPGGQGQPPLELHLRGLPGCGAWAAETALALLAPLRVMGVAGSDHA